MKKRLFCILICMLTISITFVSVSGTIISEKNPCLLSNGNILYVGGSGLGNYSTIQEAIEASVAGDTVFVFDDSSPYYENVIVYKSITLLGEDKGTTVIDGDRNGEVVTITVNNVDFSGFTVRNSQLHDYYAGIQVCSSEVSIHDCNLYNNALGVYLTSGARNTILNNHFEENYVGVIITTKRCSLIGNTLVNNEEGIRVNGRFNEIKENFFIENNVGLFMDIPGCLPFSVKTLSFNRVTHNLFQGNKYVGVEVHVSNGNLIKENNFINNYVHADFLFCYWQHWDKNFWFPRTFANSSCPYVIKSLFFLENIETTWFNFDWRPVREPYDIPFGA